MMAELAWREINGNLALAVRILGGRDAIARAGSKQYILNTNPHLDYHGSLYPVEVLRSFTPPTSVHCLEGHLNPQRYNQTRYRLGKVCGIHWAEHDLSLRGWWIPANIEILRQLLEAEQEGKLPDVSGDYRVEFERLVLNDKPYKLVSRITKLLSVDTVPVSTGGGKILRQSEVGTIKRVRLSAGGRILGQKGIRA